MEKFKKNRLDLFFKFLNFYWLRPEKAFLHTLRAEKYIETFKYFKGKTMDVSCGDGVFSFFSLGGKLSEECDQYQSLDTKNISNLNINRDLYDFYQKGKYKIKVKLKPKKKYTFGTDHKLNLIEKSKGLKLYKNFLLHDNNIKLPSKIGKFNYIYANSSYWVKNFEYHITDLVNKLEKGGKLVLSIKGNELSKNNFLNIIKRKFGNTAYKILDRGRRNSWRGLKNYEYYLNFFKTFKNLKIIKITPIFDKEILNIWDIGLRPIFKPLVILISGNKKTKVKQSKKLLVKVIFNIFKNYLVKYKVNKKQAVERLVILEKK